MNKVFKHVVCPLLAGGFIYILFRNIDAPINKIILKSDFLSSYFFLVRDTVKIELPYWIVFGLPDGLYAYSFTSFLILYNESYLKFISEFNLNKILIISFVLSSTEFLELFNIMSGTFDVIDVILFGSFPFISYYFLIYKNKVTT